ncbi:hypothetical protein [Bradyrhizobium tunisiense]|uniref:hypothetical protein n=1 Tax=Bradyrhizobium tunisiense TaxID=3278709 RepID=UPI0035DB30CE
MQLKRYAIYGRPESVNFLPLRSFDKLVVGLAADPNRLIPERESSQARLILCRRDFFAAHVPLTALETCVPLLQIAGMLLQGAPSRSSFFRRQFAGRAATGYLPLIKIKTSDENPLSFSKA